MRRFALLALLLSVPSLAGSAPAQEPAAASEASFGRDVAEYLARLEERGFAGTVLVVQGDERSVEAGLGLADREKQTPWTTRTHSTIGSISKQFTGAAILKLAEEGELSVDDPLSLFFEECPEDKSEITLHHLLTHSSGVQGLEKRDDEWVSRDELLSAVLGLPLQFEPGERYEYSNAGYSILAAVIEDASGMDYEKFLREELLLPAGMKETGYLLPDYAKERLAVGYRGAERWGTMLEDMYFEDGPSWVLRGNGGIYSTAEDMLLWMRALSSGEVLSEDSMQELWGRHVDKTNGARRSFYGYGWALFNSPDGRPLVSHNGNDAGPCFFNDLMWLPEQETFLFLQTNTYQQNTEAVLGRIVRRLTVGTPLPN